MIDFTKTPVFLIRAHDKNGNILHEVGIFEDGRVIRMEGEYFSVVNYLYAFSFRLARSGSPDMNLSPSPLGASQDSAPKNR
jgi:hypothetical protein